MWRRLRAIVIKELLALLRDPRGRWILIGPPIIQLFLFSYAATLEVTHADVAVLNQDSGAYAVQLIARIEGSPTIGQVILVQTPAELRKVIDQRQALAAVSIDATFSREIAAGRPAPVQIILDGRRSNASQIMGGYLTSIAQNFLGEPPAAPFQERYWFNPTLDNQWFMVPNLVAVIAVMIGLVVTGLSIARERELGTFDQLMVSPLRSHEILIGKCIPSLLIGYLHCTIFVIIAVFWFGVPLRGSLLLFYLVLFFYLLALIGIGLFISALCATQQQAILGSFLFMIPAILMSGFATPVENMPIWLQTLSLGDPVRWFIVIVRGTFLKGLPLDLTLRSILPLALIALVTLTGANWMFRRRME